MKIIKLFLFFFKKKNVIQVLPEEGSTRSVKITWKYIFNENVECW